MRIVWVFFEGRAISPRDVRTALLYGSIRTAFGAISLRSILASAPGYVLDRCAVRAHTLSSFSLLETESQ